MASIEVSQVSIEVSQEDLSSFYTSHFSTPSVKHFAQQFLGPVEEYFEEEEDDDGLGYYEDGAKRTLTDEQIDIFRHSEIETLLRERRHLAELLADALPTESAKLPEEIVAEAATIVEDGELEDGELEILACETPISTPSSNDIPSNNKKKKNKKTKKRQQVNQNSNQKGFFKQNVKPDLRKRTWDKVEAGLEDLQYDDADSGAVVAPSRGPQRRKISYDGD